MDFSQKELFLNGEGNKWFQRNYRTLKDWDTKIDPVRDLVSFEKIGINSKSNILEIGCGQGFRLKKLQDDFKCSVVGIDPSSDSIEFANNLGLTAFVGTADHLPFEDDSFDLIIFGFCLYLCDRDDLFKIIAESHRVLKKESWIIINDFWVNNDFANEYIHKPGIRSYKTDYSKLFTWHPCYSVYKHSLYHHSTLELTDNFNEHVCVTLIRVTS